MANPLHLELLREGTETWNRWIRIHPFVVVDFSEAQLEHFNFDNAHLIGANFIGANLSHATFRGAYLSWSEFQNAYLRATDFSRALLYKATLSRANFRAADLREANLYGQTSLGRSCVTHSSPVPISETLISVGQTSVTRV